MTKQLEALIADLKFYAGEAQCHPDPNYCLEFEKLSTPGNILTLIAALERAQQHNKELQTKLDATEAVALALRDEVRGAEKRIAELDASETQLIEERDNAEEALADMYQAATGERPEWSNWFSFADAVDAVEQRLGELESSPLAVKLPDLVNFDDLDANSQDREVVE